MGEQGGLMAGKRGLIMGVANDRSIAWGIARAVAEQGGELAFTYQGEALGKRVLPLAQSIGVDFVVPCDVGDDGSVDSVFPPSPSAGAGWIFWFTPSPFPTRRS
jgi:enoyl-[acyl-carrier protein] reductase I